MAHANVHSRFISGDLHFQAADGSDILTVDGTNKVLTFPDGCPALHQIRVRLTIAQINAGATLLAAVAGLKYRLVDTTVISIGGAASGLTLLRIHGTQAAGDVLLVTHTQASLTRSTVLKPNTAGAVVLADGASFAPNDANTGITVDVSGSSIATATAVDFLLSFTLEA